MFVRTRRRSRIPATTGGEAGVPTTAKFFPKKFAVEKHKSLCFVMFDAAIKGKLFTEEDFPPLQASYEDFQKGGKSIPLAKIGEATIEAGLWDTVIVYDHVYDLKITILRRGKLGSTEKT